MGARPIHEVCAKLPVVGARNPVPVECHRKELDALQLPLFAELYARDGRDGGQTAGRQPADADEVAQRIEDRPAPLALDGPQHVRPVAHHHVGTAVDGGAGEGHG